MENKIRKLFAGIMVFGILSQGVTGYAYVDETGEYAEYDTETYWETVPETEATPFAIPGNGQLVDDKEDDDTKQFLTVQTKNGNTFFLVIDRSSNMENVYMLSMIDEDDLAEFIPAEEQSEMATEAPQIWIPETELVETEPLAAPETEEPKESISRETIYGGGMIAAILLVLLIIFKAIKPKKAGEGAREEDLEFYDDTYTRDDQDDSDLE